MSQIRPREPKGHARVGTTAERVRWQGGRVRSGRGAVLAAARREVEELLARDEAILNSLCDAVLVSDLSGKIIYMNPAGLAMYGFKSLGEAQHPHEELREDFETLGPDGHALAPDEFPLMRIIAGEHVSGFEMTVRRRSRPGSPASGGRILSYSGELARSGSGEPLLAIVTMRDITESRRSEQERGALLAELQTLLDVSSSLVSTLDLPQLLRMLVTKFRAATGAEAVTIFRSVDEELQVVEYEGGLPRAQALAIRVPLGRGFAFPHVLRLNEPVYVEDLVSDSELAVQWREMALPEQKRLSQGMRSWLSLPLSVQGRVIGVVRLAHSLPNRFSPGTIRLATGIANQAAVAIENAGLHAAAREAAVWEERERLARELHDSVSQILFGVDMAAFSALTHLEKNPQRARERLEMAYNLNKTAQKEMRALIFELRADTIATNGMVATLDLAMAAIEDRYRLQVSKELCPEPQVALEVKEAFYRVAIEALNNAGKYAASGPVGFRLACEEDALELEVIDHGHGFDATGDYPGHFGLRMMRERAASIGAALYILSRPGDGTQVRLSYRMNPSP